MLRKEHIKQAIEAISERDAEIGYALDEMLSMDRIRPLTAEEEDADAEDLTFVFEDRTVTVKKGIFFNQGTAPIEERLLVRYGEMLERQRLDSLGKELNFKDAAIEVRAAGFRLMVAHEIEYALCRLNLAVSRKGMDPERLPERSLRLRAIQTESRRIFIKEGSESEGNGGLQPLYSGTVDNGKRAYFVRFPFCLDALMQAADINLAFFNIRFLLSCLVDGEDENLFACVVENRIEGIVFLKFKESHFHESMEIHFIATVAGRPETEWVPGRTALKGVGTFLTAGVWMLWKNRLHGIMELLLDSEIGARRFYEGIGFQSRGLSGFVMKEPAGRLVRAIGEMANDCPGLKKSAEVEIVQLMKKQVKALRKRRFRFKADRKKAHALEAVVVCLSAGAHPTIFRSVLEEIRRYRKHIPEAASLLERSAQRP